MPSQGTDPLHVAIDGPAGSGKSSVARAVAEALGLDHVDTGAMYRALTRIAMDEGIELSDAEALAARLRALDLHFHGGEIVVDGVSLGARIRTPEVDDRVSRISALPEVRTAMQERQRAFGWRSDGVVMEGRDIGSVVLPLARCKIFLTAAVEERARRRAAQAGRGLSSSAIEQVAAQLRERDRQDSERQHSPLRQMPDAHLVDSTVLDEQQTVDRILELARNGRPMPEHDRPRYWLSRYRFWHARVVTLMHWGLQIEVHGSAHEDEISAGAIFACNHVARWDPFLLGSMINRQVAFLAKVELFRWPVGTVLRWFGVVPIVRGSYDAEAFEVTRDHLRGGRNVAIFPEGTRMEVNRPGPVKRGLGILVESAGVPWLPCLVRGTGSLRAARDPGQPMELWIGPPSYPVGIEALRASGLDSEQIEARVGELFLAQIQALSQRAQEHRARPDHSSPK